MTHSVRRHGGASLLVLDLSLPGSDITMTAGDFANLAYLEMRVDADSNLPSYWCDFRLKTDDFYHVEALTIRADGAFRTYQIPLRVLVAAMPLTYKDLTTAGVTEFGVGGLWGDKSHVWIDDVYLKW